MLQHNAHPSVHGSALAIPGTHRPERQRDDMVDGSG